MVVDVLSVIAGWLCAGLLKRGLSCSTPRLIRLLFCKMDMITQLINAAEAGSTFATQQLFDRVYDDLRRMATAKIAGENPNLTLQPTALVHEVYLRMFGIQRQ